MGSPLHIVVIAAILFAFDILVGTAYLLNIDKVIEDDRMIVEIGTFLTLFVQFARLMAEKCTVGNSTAENDEPSKTEKDTKTLPKEMNVENVSNEYSISKEGDETKTKNKTTVSKQQYVENSDTSHAQSTGNKKRNGSMVVVGMFEVLAAMGLSCFIINILKLILEQNVFLMMMFMIFVVTGCGLCRYRCGVAAKPVQEEPADERRRKDHEVNNDQSISDCV